MCFPFWTPAFAGVTGFFNILVGTGYPSSFVLYFSSSL
jgi:hypothetical protein